MTRRALVLVPAILGSLFLGCDNNNGNTQTKKIGTTQQGVTSCPSSPAPQLFDRALCLCGDLDLIGSGLQTQASGPAKASVGVNGMAHLVGSWNIDGEMTAWLGVEGTGDARVSGTMLTNGSFSVTGQFSIDQDLAVGGDLMNVGQLTVGGALRVAGLDTHVGERDIASTATYTAPAAAPCGCDGPAALDIDAAVATAATQNDNAKLDLDTAIATPGAAELALPTGVYYLARFDSVGQKALHIQGAVALYVDGPISAVGDHQITMDPGSSLDLYVKGSVSTVGAIAFGDPANPGTFRLYVGGADPLLLNVGDQTMNGLIYAPKAMVEWVGATMLRGALFADSLTSTGDIGIAYDAAALAQPAQCDPSKPEPTPGDDQPVFVL